MIDVEMVKYDGLSKAEVLVALWEYAQYGGASKKLADIMLAASKKAGYTNFDNPEIEGLTIEEAEKYVSVLKPFEEGGDNVSMVDPFFTMVKGKLLCVELIGDESFDPTEYDDIHGKFAAKNAILDYRAKKIRQEKLRKVAQSKPLLEKGPINIEIEMNTKVIEKEEIDIDTIEKEKIDIDKIEKEIDEIQANAQGAIPQFKILKWADYAQKHPTTISKNGTLVHKGQVLYIETLKYNWTSTHIHFVSEVNTKIEEFNKDIAEKGIQDAQILKKMSAVRVLIAKHKRVLSDCENFDEVINMINKQSKEIGAINSTTLNK